ncbi:MAG: hypothetical protein H6842_01870 [Rhodospirillaceae bacterium]|nr:hypothetical protein [Rhodospirillaceae bacterium]
MTSLDELRQRVRAAEENFGKVGNEDREYAERLAGLVETMDGRLREQRQEVEAIRTEFDRLKHENEELRGMLLSLLLSVERGGRAQLGQTMQELYARMSTLAGAVGMAPPLPPPVPRDVLPPDAGLDEPELEGEPADEAEPAVPAGPVLVVPDVKATPLPDDTGPGLGLPPLPEQEAPGEPAVRTTPTTMQAAVQTADDDGDFSGLPELDALAADVTAAAAEHLSGVDDLAEEEPGDLMHYTPPRPPLTAAPAGTGGPPGIDETARLSGADVRDQLRASRPSETTRGGVTSGVEVKVGGDEGRPRPFERIIQRMSMAAQGEDRERTD